MTAELSCHVLPINLNGKLTNVKPVQYCVCQKMTLVSIHKYDSSIRPPTVSETTIVRYR